MSELTAKENIKAADTVKRITATAVMAALTTLTIVARIPSPL